MSDEIILNIQETEFSHPNNGYGMDGFIIETNKQKIKVGISNTDQCCEQWGYFMSKDNISEFIGAVILNITLTNKCLITKDVLNDLYEGDAMFVNIETNKGTLQFTAYNQHNGYYGHDACIVSFQLNHIENI